MTNSKYLIARQLDKASIALREAQRIATAEKMDKDAQKLHELALQLENYAGDLSETDD